MILIFNYDEEEAVLLRKAAMFAIPFEKTIIVRRFDEAWVSAVKEEVRLFIVSLMGDYKVSGRVSGIEFIKKLRRYDAYRYTDIILTAERDDIINFINRGIYCVGMLEKPLDFTEAGEMLHFLKERWKMKPVINPRLEGILCYSRYNRKQYIFIRSIIFTEKHSRYLSIHTIGSTITLDIRRAKKICEELDEKGFISVNRSDSINPDYIVTFNENEIFLRGASESIPVSPNGINRLNHYFDERRHLL